MFDASIGMHVVMAPSPRLYGWDCVGEGMSAIGALLRVFELLTGPDKRGEATLKAVGLDAILQTHLGFFKPLEQLAPALSCPPKLRLTSVNAVRFDGIVIPLFLGHPEPDAVWHYGSARSLERAGLKHGVTYTPAEWSFELRGVVVQGVQGVFHPALFEPLTETGEPYEQDYAQWNAQSDWSG